jgi:uncharacterized NAD(P)/FAD-binding protein YdhS
MRIAIIGAGFSGVITAVHLLRGDGKGSPCSVMLINRSGRTARGVAYGTRSAAHVLNVPAGRMSAFADDEESFLRFARERDSTVSGGSFVSRSLYGDYLDQLLLEAEASAPAGITLDRIVGHAVDIDVAPDALSASLTLADGRVFEADRVVLALGNFAPANPSTADRSFDSSDRYVRDPWAPGALDQIGEDDSVLLIGTGLTMYDIALELAARGVHRPMQAISRRGLTAHSHRPHGRPPTFDHLPRELENGEATALSYLRAVRSEIARLPAGKGDWRDVIASLRPVTPALWSAMSDRERARFMRHLRPFWEVHRHRAAPETAAAVEQLRADGKLIVSAGRIVAFEENAECVRVTWRPRSSGADLHGTFTRVINCTGPTSNLSSAGEPLIDILMRKGLLACDQLGLGVRVSNDGALAGFDDVPSSVLFYVGPLLKARYWEATAVPELRVHAARLAESLRAAVEARP